MGVKNSQIEMTSLDNLVSQGYRYREVAKNQFIAFMQTINLERLAVFDPPNLYLD